MVKIAFCDDNPSILEEINALLKQYCEGEGRQIKYTPFYSPLELLADIERGERYDVLILDVLMPGENGIDTAREIREYDSNVKIIFLTSSAEFAVQSYTVGAYYYQMKPIAADNFLKLIDTVVRDCKRENEKSLIVRCKSGIERIDLDELEYCEVTGRTLLFHMENGKIFERTGTLDQLQAELAGHKNFLRPHRSFLINMEHIQNISYRAITMVSGTEFPIPHGKYSEIKDLYLEYAFSRKQVFI